MAAKSTTWREYSIPKNQFGELTFFDDGAVQIGNRVFLTNSMIADVSFANGHVARRRLDQTNILEVTAPDGERYYFRYAPIFCIWYRRIPETAAIYSSFKQQVRSLGPIVGPLWWASGGNTRNWIVTLGRLIVNALPILIPTILILLLTRLIRW